MPFYKPRPFIRILNTRFICMSCWVNVPDCPVLKDEVWNTIITRPITLLCITCAVDILGRPLAVTDLKVSLANQGILYFVDQEREQAMTRLSSKLRSVTINDKPGVSWFCPGCEEMHKITIHGEYGWDYNDNPEFPTFHPSVKVEGGKVGLCHAVVKVGMIQFLLDSTHKLAGQTVEMPDFF
jgi:hypothetical protein